MHCLYTSVGGRGLSDSSFWWRVHSICVCLAGGCLHALCRACALCSIQCGILRAILLEVVAHGSPASNEKGAVKRWYEEVVAATLVRMQ
eukprot:6483362-Amphidinium_carterae.1